MSADFSKKSLRELIKLVGAGQPGSPHEEALKTVINYRQSQRAFGASVLLTVISILVSIVNLWSSYSTAKLANNVNASLLSNSNVQLDREQKKLSFDIINTLYKDFYQFDQNNSLVIRKLKNHEQIQDEFNLGLYLNGFEDLYEQCKSGLISKEDIRVHFQHLINPLCDNAQIAAFLQQRGNGLKILCEKFYHNSGLGKKADLQKDSCK